MGALAREDEDEDEEEEDDEEDEDDKRLDGRIDFLWYLFSNAWPSSFCGSARAGATS